MGIPLIAGREFTRSDAAQVPKVAIVNEAFARRFGLDRDAVGKRMRVGSGNDLDIEIVGLVQDAKYSEVKGEIPSQYFVPYRQDAATILSFYLRTESDPDTLLSVMSRVVATLDPNPPVEQPRTMQDQIRDNVTIDRFIGTLSAAFAVLATLLAAVGLYGVLAYTVSQRTREIGLRMALGVDGTRVRGMILRQVSWMTAVGRGIGLTLAVGAAPQGHARGAIFTGGQTMRLWRLVSSHSSSRSEPRRWLRRPARRSPSKRATGTWSRVGWSVPPRPR